MDITQYLENKLELIALHYDIALDEAQDDALYGTAMTWYDHIRDREAGMTQQEIDATNWDYVDWLRAQKRNGYYPSDEEAIAKLEWFEEQAELKQLNR